jgi:GNAT superfamily N-acetyltransferase
VGTIAAFVDHRSNDYRGERIGGFGFFEMVEDYDVAGRLLDAACEAVRSWGMDGIRGPTNFSDMEEPGVLIDGADCPPAILEAHTPLYYHVFLERYGMERFHDNYAWRVYLPRLGPNLEGVPPDLLRVFSAASERSDVRIRKLRLGDWESEVALAHGLFNATLKDLPEYAPADAAEFHRLADQMRPVLDPDLALFAEADGKTVGFLVAIPDINQVLRHLNGRLFPFGWLPMLWYSRRIDVVSFKLLGILEQYRRRGLDALMYLQAVRAAAAKGYRWLDGSLTSDNNPTVVRLAERFGAERYKHYRLFQRMFQGDAAGGRGA